MYIFYVTMELGYVQVQIVYSKHWPTRYSNFTLRTWWYLLLLGGEWAHTYTQERAICYQVQWITLRRYEICSFEISSYAFCFIKVVALGGEIQFLNNFSSTFKSALFWFLFVWLSLQEFSSRKYSYQILFLIKR